MTTAAATRSTVAADGQRHRGPLVALLVGYAVSLVGSRLSMIALPLFVLATTGSATRTGLVAMAETAPYVVSQALAGPVTDRVGARRVSVLSDCASTLVVGLIPLLHAVHALPFGTLLALVTLAGLVRGPGDGAKYVMVPTVAGAAGMPVERAIAFSDGISRGASVVGPLGAAALVSSVGAPGALAVDAASFAVAALVVGLGVSAAVSRAANSEDGGGDHDGSDDGSDDGASYLRRLRAGARFVRRDGLLRSIVGMLAVTNLLDAALSGVLLAVWAREATSGTDPAHPGFSSAALMGTVVAVMSAGAVIGTLAAAAIGHRMPRRLVFAVSFFLIGGPRYAVLALGAPLWAVVAVLFVGGLGTGTINPILGAVIIERIPEHLRARVLSLTNSLCWTLIPFGGVVGGLLSDRLGVSTALLLCGIAYTVTTTLPALRPEWAQMNRP